MCKKDVKSPISYEGQLNKLESNGLIIDDRANAIKVLKRVNYYRFKAYTFSYKSHNKFYMGVTFEKIYALYEFDKRLRNLIMDMLENIEIAVRAQIAYTHSHKYGALGYEDPKNFENEDIHKAFMGEVEKEQKRSKEMFLLHNCANYKDLAFWVAIEILPFGTLSKLFKNLKVEDKKHIVQTYYDKTPYSYMQNWLQVLSHMRNTCAHYSRLYNREFTIVPRLHRNDRRNIPNPKKVFSNLYVMKRLCPEATLWKMFFPQLQALILQYDADIRLDLIGFPKNWEQVLEP